MNAMNPVLTGLLAIGLLCGCSSPENKTPQETPVVSTPAETAPTGSAVRFTVYVSRDGKLFLNGRAAELKELPEALKAHKLKGGTVSYSRDDQQQDPHETALQVMDLIAGQGLPIRFYTDSTFRHAVEF